jgi:hypothetical protein
MLKWTNLYAELQLFIISKWQVQAEQGLGFALTYLSFFAAGSLTWLLKTMLSSILSTTLAER